MSQVKHGGAAFPVDPGSGQESRGMTLRDYFAGRAMQGLAADVGNAVMEGRAKDVYPLIAGVSYALADAMLQERDRK